MKRVLIILCAISLSSCLYSKHHSKKDEGAEFVEQMMKDRKRKGKPSSFTYLYNRAKTDADRKRLEKYALPGQLQIELEMHKKGTENWKAFTNVTTIKELAKPKTVAVIGGTALAVFAAYYFTKVVAEIIGHHVMIPPLAKETSILSWSDSIKKFFVYKEDEVAPRSSIIFNPELYEQVDEVAKSIMTAAQNDLGFIHSLLYGPPGTGKTMTARAIAHEAGLEFIYFSASKLCQYTPEEGIKQIDHLFEYAKNYPKKVLIAMDEADALFVDRDSNSASDKVQQFLNQILTHMGTEQSNFVVIAMSNRPHVFDSAALSRFGTQIYVGPPGVAERRNLFKQYSVKYFIEAHTVNRDKRAFYQKLFSEKPQQRRKLTVDDDVWADETFEELAQKSEGMVGRDIMYVMSHVQHAAYRSSDLTVRKEMILRQLALMKLRKEQWSQGFPSLAKHVAPPSKRAGSPGKVA